MLWWSIFLRFLVSLVIFTEKGMPLYSLKLIIDQDVGDKIAWLIDNDPFLCVARLMSWVIDQLFEIVLFWGIDHLFEVVLLWGVTDLFGVSIVGSVEIEVEVSGENVVASLLVVVDLLKETIEFFMER